MRKKDTELKVIEETSKIIKDMEKGFYEILANHTMKICIAYEDELIKYKRAFEILKDLIIFDKENQAVANGTNIIDLSKEEYELLEELMKGE